jgi:hypothetical protein
MDPNREDDPALCSPDVGGQVVPGGLVGRDIARVAQNLGDTTKPEPEQVTALRHLQTDLDPVLASIDVIPSHTDDPALIQAAARVHDALRELLAEMAVVIYGERRRSRGLGGNSIPSKPGGSR